MSDIFRSFGQWLLAFFNINLPWGITFGQTIGLGIVFPILVKIILGLVGNLDFNGVSENDNK